MPVGKAEREAEAKRAIARNLGRLIYHSPMSEAAVARAVGKLPQWLNRRTKGEASLAGEDIVLLAEILGVSPSAFFEEVMPAPTEVKLAAESVQATAAATAQAVLRALREQAPERSIGEREVAEGVARALRAVSGEPEQFQPTERDAALRDLVAIWQRLPPDQQEQFEAMLRDLKRRRASEPGDKESHPARRSSGD